MHGKIGADMKGIVDASFSASGKVAITVKVGELLCQKISDASFMSALKKRYHTIKYFWILLHIRLDGNKSFKYKYKFGIHTLETISN